jgi:hypothetical protein
VPLSSDAFSGWSMYDDERIENQKVFLFSGGVVPLLSSTLQDVQAATQRIFTECIPALINELSAIDIDKLSGYYFSGKQYHLPFSQWISVSLKHISQSHSSKS